MTHATRFGAVLGLAAAGAMAAAPAAAADLPIPVSKAPTQYSFAVFDSEASTAEHHRYRRYYHRRNRIDAGDVIAGVLVLGGIAAIASAASNNKKKDRYRDRDYDRDYDRRYDDRRSDDRSTGSRGLDNAVSQCLSRIERDVRVDTVDGVDRTGEGWIVTGSLYNGEGFSCRINNNGRIDSVDYGGYSGASASSEDRQWSDADYYQARQSMDRGSDTAQPQPAYPGGPLPGEEIDGDLGG
jgi:hypothetical protein